MPQQKLESVVDMAAKAKALRRDILLQVYKAQSGHPGGSLSWIDFGVALYYHEMTVFPEDPANPKRDRFVLSKGHACPAQYALLADQGFFPKAWLETFRQYPTKLQGHAENHYTPGVEVTTGSLGQGLPQAVGIALGLKVQKSDSRVYCVVGDGESQEGVIWEAAMAASHHKLDNLCVFHDLNGLQIDGAVKKVMNIHPIAEKWAAFGWAVKEIDGHDFTQILEALAWARTIKGQPAMICAATVKGKGVSFMENQSGWHGVAPKQEEFEKALAELAD
ncbi:MAG TPA: transketolase [Geothrix sp.]|nr:transketolase [Geothrix sp.]